MVSWDALANRYQQLLLVPSAYGQTLLVADTIATSLCYWQCSQTDYEAIHSASLSTAECTVIRVQMIQPAELYCLPSIFA